MKHVYKWMILASLLLVLGVSQFLFAFSHEHTILDNLMKQHVKNGLMDYRSLQQNAAELNRYLEELASVSQSEYTSWNRNQKLAFLINAYNAYTMQSIIQAYPVRSIRRIPNVWDQQTHVIAGVQMSLDQLEHGIMRGQRDQLQGIPGWMRDSFNEPRIHMALNCASKGCPPFPPGAFKPYVLDRQLHIQSQQFVNSSEHVQLDPRSGVVRISELLKWFGEDFIPVYANRGVITRSNRTEQAILNFIYRYISHPQKKAYLQNATYQVQYKAYDWSLNDIY
jgi:hypothetical protein